MFTVKHNIHLHMDKEKYYTEGDLILMCKECQDMVDEYSALVEYYKTRCDFAEKQKSEEEYALDAQTLQMIENDAEVIGKKIDDKLEAIALLAG